MWRLHHAGRTWSRRIGDRWTRNCRTGNYRIGGYRSRGTGLIPFQRWAYDGRVWWRCLGFDRCRGGRKCAGRSGLLHWSFGRPSRSVRLGLRRGPNLRRRFKFRLRHRFLLRRHLGSGGGGGIARAGLVLRCEPVTRVDEPLAGRGRTAKTAGTAVHGHPEWGLRGGGASAQKLGGWIGWLLARDELDFLKFSGP